MRIKKIIYFIESPFCQRDFERFGIDIMKSNGFDTEIWDISSLINPGIHNIVKVPDPIDYQKSNCRLFMNKTELMQEIKHLKLDTIVIFIMFFDYEHFFLYRALSRQNISYAFIITNTIPAYKSKSKEDHSFKKNRITDLAKKLRRLNLEKMKKYVFNRVPYSLLMIQFPEFIFTGGYTSLVNYKFPIGEKTKIVWCHTLDYDLYLKDLSKFTDSGFKSRNYIVFCDECIPFHPEYINMNMEHPIPLEVYYPAVCKFFDKVERETGLKVIIAAHPRSRYEEYPDYFDGRKVIRGKTMELVRDSEFVLMHGSTSLNFAVLYHKPVLFFTMAKIQQSEAFFRDYIRVFSSELNKGFINIDGDCKIDWDKELKMDEEAYANYKEKYIKRKNSKEEFFWQIVADEIKKL